MLHRIPTHPHLIIVPRLLTSICVRLQRNGCKNPWQIILGMVEMESGGDEPMVALQSGVCAL